MIPTIYRPQKGNLRVPTDEETRGKYIYIYILSFTFLKAPVWGEEIEEDLQFLIHLDKMGTLMLGQSILKGYKCINLLLISFFNVLDISFYKTYDITPEDPQKNSV